MARMDLAGDAMNGISIRQLAHLTLAVLCAAAALAGSPQPAAAQDDMEKARKAFKRGKRLYNAEDYEEAAKSFKQAYEYSGRSALLFNIGQSYRKAGELRKAEKYFQKYLDKKPDAPNRQEVLDKVVAVQKKLAARMASVKVTTPSKGASVFVDDEDKPRCSTPCTVSLKPGSYEIRTRSKGANIGTKSVEVEKGESTAVAFESRPKGGLHVRTQTGEGSVRVEGVGEKKLPMKKPMQVPAGNQQVRVVESSGGEWKGKISVEAGETTRVLVSTSTGGGGGGLRRNASFGLAGASVALFAGGAILGTNAKQTHELLTRRRNAGNSVDPSLVDKGQREQTAANIMFSVGAATLLSGVGLFTWDLLASGSGSE